MDNADTCLVQISFALLCTTETFYSLLQVFRINLLIGAIIKSQFNTDGCGHAGADVLPRMGKGDRRYERDAKTARAPLHTSR